MSSGIVFFQVTRTCVAFDHAPPRKAPRPKMLEMFCRGPPEKSVGLQLWLWRASWPVAFSLCVFGVFVGWLVLRVCLGFLVGLLCPSTQCLCRSDNTTTPAKLQAQHGVLLLLLLTLAETGRGRCKYVWCAWVLPLQSFTHSPHQITLPTRLTHDTVPTRSKPRARRTTLLPSCPCFGTARTSARLVSAPTPTPTPSRQPQPPLAHHAGAGLAIPNATRPDRPSSSGPLARHHLLDECLSSPHAQASSPSILSV